MAKNSNKIKLLAKEKQAVKWLSVIIAFRMLGLFMLLPILALHAEEFIGSTPALIGLAIGIYGLTQAILQIPFGILSDRFGRKKVMVTGFLLFAVGSLVAAMADSIYILIVGRALQGAGAVAAVAMALLADLTREEVRVRSMAVFGISIGFSFMLAIVMGPVLSAYIGVSGVFFLTAIMAFLAILLLIVKVPNPSASSFHAESSLSSKQFLEVIQDRQLLRLDFGIFSLHMVLTAMFIVVPNLLQEVGQIRVETHGLMYLVVMLLSIVIMFPFIIAAETKDKMKQVFVGAVVFLALAQVLFLNTTNSIYSIVLALVVFFSAFNVLEASLPSLVAKIAPIDKKGTAMGVYSSSQFAGAFTGGALGGWLLEYTASVDSVFWLSLLVLLAWLVFAVSMQKPNAFGTTLLNIGKIDIDNAKALTANILAVPGVREVKVAPAEGLAYVRIANDKIDRKRLLQYSINKLEVED